MFSDGSRGPNVNQLRVRQLQNCTMNTEAGSIAPISCNHITCRVPNPGDGSHQWHGTSSTNVLSTRGYSENGMVYFLLFRIWISGCSSSRNSLVGSVVVVGRVQNIFLGEVDTSWSSGTNRAIVLYARIGRAVATVRLRSLAVNTAMCMCVQHATTSISVLGCDSILYSIVVYVYTPVSSCSGVFYCVCHVGFGVSCIHDNKRLRVNNIQL